MMFLHVLLLLSAFPPSTAKGRLRKFDIALNQIVREDAVNECRINYTDLITVYDQEDNRELSTLLDKLFISNVNGSPSGWIGARLGNRSKKWSNGDEVTYTKDIRCCGETCCATMKPDGDWESIQCNDTKPFVCYEQDVGRASYDYKFIDKNKTWFEAQLYCRKNHTDLVSIRSEEENERVKQEKPKNESYWIGLLEDSVEWSDGGQSAYRNWKDEDLQKTSSAVYVSDRGWVKDDYSNDIYPLCYKSFIDISPGHMSWEEALDHCNTQHNTSGLLRIESKDDQIETERELQRQNSSEPVWIGLRQSRLFGFWIWSNGLHLGPWTNWKEGSAPEHLISEHCGAMEKVDGQYKWSDKDCRSTFRVLCEVK